MLHSSILFGFTLFVIILEYFVDSGHVDPEVHWPTKNFFFIIIFLPWHFLFFLFNMMAIR